MGCRSTGGLLSRGPFATFPLSFAFALGLLALCLICFRFVASRTGLRLRSGLRSRAFPVPICILCFPFVPILGPFRLIGPAGISLQRMLLLRLSIVTSSTRPMCMTRHALCSIFLVDTLAVGTAPRPELLFHDQSVDPLQKLKVLGVMCSKSVPQSLERKGAQDHRTLAM